MRFDQTAFPNREDAQRLSARLIAQMDTGLQRLTEARSESPIDKALQAIEIAQVKPLQTLHVLNHPDQANMSWLSQNFKSGMVTQRLLLCWNTLP